MRSQNRYVRVGRGRIDMRWMTAREYARLQGAGDFPIRVPERQALFGFGDAVCVPVIEWLDRHLLTPVADAIRADAFHLTASGAARPAADGTRPEGRATLSPCRR